MKGLVQGNNMGFQKNNQVADLGLICSLEAGWPERLWDESIACDFLFAAPSDWDVPSCPPPHRPSTPGDTPLHPNNPAKALLSGNLPTPSSQAWHLQA